ncbi:MAG TPA: hypothetical protein DHU55_18725 [Blastocatellia bacterium]|nr:hypothetical protein [Blastocatellia bacterium]
MSSLIESTWAAATVMIQSTSNRGTGFLVGRSVGQDQWRIYLVTNKHVLDPDTLKRRALKSVRLYLNIEKNGQLTGEQLDYALQEQSVSRVREHPDAEVDVLAIDVVPLFNARKDIRNKFVGEDLFGVAAKRKELDITAGEEIMVVGYPSGIRQGRTNHPIIRQGIIATRIGEELHEELPQPGGGTKMRVSRAFLIDGATIPGSSGSPVVLKPVIGRQQANTIMMGTVHPVLLGIVAETRFAAIDTGAGVIPGFAGLGFVFDVEAIVEVLDLF